MRNPQKKLSKETEKRQFSLGSYDRELGLQIFLFRGFEKPKHHRIFSPREREMAKTVAPKMRTVFCRDLCERNGGSKHGVGKTLVHNEARSPRFCLLSGFFQQKIKTGDLKRLVDQNKSRFVFCFFPPEFWGKEQKKKRQIRHIYRIRSWRSPKKKKQRRIL